MMQVGPGTTTLDYLKKQYPWLKDLLIKQEKEIAGLKETLKSFCSCKDGSCKVCNTLKKEP